jgi:hypothetical protein
MPFDWKISQRERSISKDEVQHRGVSKATPLKASSSNSSKREQRPEHSSPGHFLHVVDAMASITYVQRDYGDE